MTRIHRRRTELRHVGGWIAFALVGVASIGATVFGGGARAEHTAALTRPTLETLLQQRDANPPESAVTPESEEELRARFEELRSRRVDIEGALPAALRTPRSRRPELRELGHDLDEDFRAQVGSVDLSRGDPDRVAGEARR
jgi:hypothetical protein